jgi:uncharacterized protein with HEPN domain
MRPEERDAAYVWDMLSAAREVTQVLGTLTEEQFSGNLLVIRAVERCIEIIGEAARRVSASTKAVHPQIPWSDIIGQRNILAHEYGQIDYELLYRTARKDVPQLVVLLQQALPDE